MKKILIIGLGLIGSSIALGIKKAHPEFEILGSDREEVENIAQKRGIIDSKVELVKGAQEADIIILAVPISATLELLKQIVTFDLKDGLLITDAGSTKSEIVKLANQLFSGTKVKFIGGHPMVGSHKSGVMAADINLFENAYYVLTEESQELRELLKGLHAKFIILDAKEHDKVTGQVSHFPHILASTLVWQSDDYAKEHPLVKHLAAGGFRDLTRIAEADSLMWTSVLLSNPEITIDRIENFKKQLDGIAQKIANRDSQAIEHFFEEGKKIRQAMEIHKGALPNFYDLFISVPDEKGVVLRVLALLQDFSITNIKINEENREDIHGQLQISFKRAEDLQEACEIIEKATDFTVV
ncbi:prephenate dehydrogenase [Lactococcus cremoris]|uniref:prephenate dehydrogenase n=1 Tax=Lactococcus lactis subsp. cremoris TaxID=1359 RepID=UPI00038B51A7|nr:MULTISPECIES: prephenate dehydrogenase [Lactococcus]EQC86345.1 prephenate dehydrogenase [Lactococcus cremoris subsp. cremoris TIFN1]ARE26537.1 prephenate dehydrogenase [Lactococcus cremoris]AXN65910.1 prephenate dehydrogenase [Lactococcus cremoris]MCT0458458.1 prephenate dehydrogenase [Lactococcus cremoris]MCT4417088.1 prephenate dehydrogenase [Lactococcus cremoris]